MPSWRTGPDLTSLSPPSGHDSPQPMSTLDFRPRVPVFDANIGVGHRHDRPFPCPDPDSLLEEMDRHGVGRGLVYHLQGERISHIAGNEALAEWEHEALVPQWVAGPGNDSLRQLQSLHGGGRLRSVRLHNTEECRVPFVDWVYGELLAWLDAEGIPLWVSLADTPTGRDPWRPCAATPACAPCSLGAHYTHSAVLAPMLERLPNASLELSRFENLGGRRGAGRRVRGRPLPLRILSSPATPWARCSSTCTTPTSATRPWRRSARATSSAFLGEAP